MIDLNLLKTVLDKSWVDFFIEDGDFLLSDLNNIDFIVDDVRSDDPRITNFDAFGYAWDRLSRSNKLRILANAYRDNKHVFNASDMLQRIGWEQFSLAQQTIIISSFNHLISSVIALVTTIACTESYVVGFVDAKKSREKFNGSALINYDAESKRVAANTMNVSMSGGAV
jgi:hypothetical protein